MSQLIDSALAIQFADQVHVNGQQAKTRLRDRVNVVPMSTNDMTVETLDSLEAVEITSRHQKTQGQDIVHGRRRLRMREFRCTIYLDRKDEVSVLVQPERNYAASVSRAMFRQFDRIVAEAALADVYTGKDMATVVTATNDGVRTVDATSGSTYDKLLEVQQNFMAFEIGTEMEEAMTLCVSEEENTDFLQEVKLTSGDYSRAYSQEKGRIVQAAGIDLKFFGGRVNSPILAVNAGNVRSCFAFAENGIQVGLAVDTEVEVSKRYDLNGNKQVQAVLMLGAVRKEGARVQRFNTTRVP